MAREQYRIELVPLRLAAGRRQRISLGNRLRGPGRGTRGAGMIRLALDTLALLAILGALAGGLRLDLALDPCAADIDARPVTSPQ